MNFTIRLTRNFNDIDVEPVRLARGQVTLQISPNKSNQSLRSHGGLRKYESFLHRGQQNNKNASFRIAPPFIFGEKVTRAIIA